MTSVLFLRGQANELLLTVGNLELQRSDLTKIIKGPSVLH